MIQKYDNKKWSFVFNSSFLLLISLSIYYVDHELQRLIGVNTQCESWNPILKKRLGLWELNYGTIKFEEKKEVSVLWQNPLHLRKIKKVKRWHKNATKMFDYTAIADQLRTISMSNDSHWCDWTGLRD